jgi:hypothetical protein
MRDERYEQEGDILIARDRIRERGVYLIEKET